MSVTGLDVFDTTVSKTNNWLNELARLLSLQDRRKTYRVLRATLHALRDRLTVEEVAQFGAQLPMLVRGFYYEQWDPTGKPLKLRHLDEFLTQIEEGLEPDDGVDAEEAARAVFALLAQRISHGEMTDILQVIPVGLRGLWPARTATS